MCHFCDKKKNTLGVGKIFCFNMNLWKWKEPYKSEAQRGNNRFSLLVFYALILIW